MTTNADHKSGEDVYHCEGRLGGSHHVTLRENGNRGYPVQGEMK
jgi:hypothetical protein